jgi:hypothetical protein
MSDTGEKAAEDLLATPQGGVADDDEVVAGPEATRSPPSAEGCAATDEGQVAGAEEGAPDDPPPVPANFLYAAYNDEDKAKENWLETLRWRKENQIEKVLQVRPSTLQGHLTRTVSIPCLMWDVEITMAMSCFSESRISMRACGHRLKGPVVICVPLLPMYQCSRVPTFPSLYCDYNRRRSRSSS